MNLLHSTPRARRSVKPRFDLLEDRCVPACTVSISGGVVTINGDNKVNKVIINDNGSGAAGNISVNCDGAVTTFNVAVTAVNVKTKGGDDKVDYNLNGDLLARVDLDVDLGGDDDRFRAILNGDIDDDLNINVKGGGGKDKIKIQATSDVDIGINGDLNIYGKGGGNEDDLYFSYQGENDGDIRFLLQGQGDDDKVRAELNLDPGSIGDVGDGVSALVSGPARVEGGGGDDNLQNIIRVNAADTEVVVVAQEIGNSGKDKGKRTANVTPSSVETDGVVV